MLRTGCGSYSVCSLVHLFTLSPFRDKKSTFRFKDVRLNPWIEIKFGVLYNTVIKYFTIWHGYYANIYLLAYYQCTGSTLFAFSTGISIIHDGSKNYPDISSTRTGLVHKVAVVRSTRYKWIRLTKYVKGEHSCYITKWRPCTISGTAVYWQPSFNSLVRSSFSPGI